MGKEKTEPRRDINLDDIPELIRRLDTSHDSPDKISIDDLPDDIKLRGRIQGYREFPDNPRGQELVTKSYKGEIAPEEQDELTNLYEQKRQK